MINLMTCLVRTVGRVPVWTARIVEKVNFVLKK